MESDIAKQKGFFLYFFIFFIYIVFFFLLGNLFNPECLFESVYSSDRKSCSFFNTPIYIPLATIHLTIDLLFGIFLCYRLTFYIVT